MWIIQRICLTIFFCFVSRIRKMSLKLACILLVSVLLVASLKPASCKSVELNSLREEESNDVTTESSPGVNFINVLWAAFAEVDLSWSYCNILRALFSPIFFCQKITKPKCNREKLRNYLLYKKRAHKMLMKSTPGKAGCSIFGEKGS